MNWTTERPIEPGFYFCYGWYWNKTGKPYLTIHELTIDYRGKLVMNEGTNGEWAIENCGYTHFMKIIFPDIPQIL